MFQEYGRKKPVYEMWRSNGEDCTMKIGIYARTLSKKSGGVREYVRSLTYAMMEQINPNDKLFIIHNLGKKYFKSGRSNVNEIILNSTNKILCDFFLGPRVMNKLKLDVVLFTKNVVPFFVKAKKIVTVHDLAYFKPEYDAYPLKDRLYMRFMIKNSCKRADKIISISKNTKEDIVKIIKIHPKKISVVYEAADDKYKVITNRKKLEKTGKKYALPNRFVLFFKGSSPRKNSLRLISAFNLACKEVEDIWLVVCGRHKCSREETELIKENSRIKKIGFVDEEDMAGLYNLAELLVYPSLYEGFGLPILEAQECGCPVVCSDKSSLPEVGGRGVQYIDPYDVEGMAKGMLKVLNDARHRRALVKRGFRNAKKFRWEKSAREVLKIIKEHE